MDSDISFPVRLTPENVHNFIGYNIEFKSPSYGGKFQREILGCAESGNSVRIDFPYLKNSLGISSGRKVYVIGNSH